jgi:hypothetical protein
MKREEEVKGERKESFKKGKEATTHPSPAASYTPFSSASLKSRTNAFDALTTTSS